MRFALMHGARTFPHTVQVVWGNARRNADGSVTCQHGPDECKNNILEGCAIVHYPETKQVRHGVVVTPLPLLGCPNHFSWSPSAGSRGVLFSPTQWYRVDPVVDGA